MNRWLQSLVVVSLVAAPLAAAAAEPEVEMLSASWVMDAPVTGEHAVALIQVVTDQVDQADFTQGEWRRFKVGMSDVSATLTLLHRYDGAASDFPTPAAGAEEWALQLTNEAYAATIEWTTLPGNRSRIQRVFSQDDRLRLLPRGAADPRVALDAALQHARLDAVHPRAALSGVLRAGHPVWQAAKGEAFELGRRGPSRIPRLLIVASGSNAYRSFLGRDATMGPGCIGWQVCGEQRGVTARK